MNHALRAALMFGGALLITTCMVTFMQHWATTARQSPSVMPGDYITPSRSSGGRSALQPVRAQIITPEECKPDQTGDNKGAVTPKFTPISRERK